MYGKQFTLGTLLGTFLYLPRCSIHKSFIYLHAYIYREREIHDSNELYVYYDLDIAVGKLLDYLVRIMVVSLSAILSDINLLSTENRNKLSGQLSVSWLTILVSKLYKSSTKHISTPLVY